jgi:hypothetical protein
LTTALEGGESSAARPGRALPLGKEPLEPTVQKAGWAPEPVWMQRLEEKFSAPVRDQTPAIFMYKILKIPTTNAVTFLHTIQIVQASNKSEQQKCQTNITNLIKL